MNVTPNFTLGLHLHKPLLWSRTQGYGCHTLYAMQKYLGIFIANQVII
jgi:hypothetical protein